MKLSIIIPTLNEKRSLGGPLASLSSLPHEIIVVDGGSKDGTVEIARKYASVVLDSKRGRGIQQHVGAQHAGGDVLLFLHADTWLPKGFEMMIERTLSDPKTVFGAFHLGHHPSTTFLNLVALMANLRSLLLSMPYGDQGIFMRRSNYFRVGGFQDLPLMEDVDLVRRLNKIGKFKLVRARVRTSARRYDRNGMVYTTVRNWSLIIRYLLGQSPERLHRFYSDAR
ncbi:MAG: TIGR04283 family arsenosugar biosynthesis glycosyltransferase [Desulfobacteraceae bacterium]|jgi:rSAM/selenodomain-associated transferase 2